jgi:hypothetical protein
VVDWIGAGNDLDFMVLPRDQIDAAAVIALGAQVGGGLDRAGALVDPATRYWVWVGNNAGATPPPGGLAYRITLCGYP